MSIAEIPFATTRAAPSRAADGQPSAIVIPFRRPDAAAERNRCDIVSVADDLMAALDDLQALAGRAARMNRPAREVERTVQSLLDAISALEQAVDGIGEGCEATPG